MNVEKIILGIDPGTRILGYSVLEIIDNKPQILVLDVLYLRQIADFNLRIRKIFDSTLRIIDTFHPDHLAIEAPFFGKNVQSMLKLGRAPGVAIAAAMSRDLSFSEYEPTTIKQTVTGNGLASKEQVAMILRSQMSFPDEPRYLDATDALAVAVCHHLQQKVIFGKTKATNWKSFIAQNADRIVK